MYKKKISGEQFTLDCINKEFEIIGSPLHWDTLEELCDWSKLEGNRHWYSDNEFKTPEQFWEWKNYFMEHIYDYKPKRFPKRDAENHFQYFNLMYGLKYGFDYEILHK